MKTHLVSSLSALLALALALVSPAMAETAFTETNTITVDTRDNYGDFAYIDNGTTITITGYTFKAAKTVDIPAFIGGKPVTSIAANAFLGCTSLQTVTIPASITSIGNNAFSGSSSLSKAIFVGNAPTTVGAGAFASTASNFKVLYNGTATGFSSPTWQGYPSQALVASTDVFANVELICRDREGIMDIVFDHLPTTLNTSPGVGDVRALYSLDGGTSWRPLRTATGDLGSNVPAGLGMRIAWDYAADGILTDPAYGTQIAIQLISTTPPGISEASIPAPNRVPVKPVQVNFCFGHPADFSVQSSHFLDFHWNQKYTGIPSPPAAVEKQGEILAVTEAIFRRAGVTSASMTFVIGAPQQEQAGKKMVNVFFTPKVGGDFGVASTIIDNKRFEILDRFNNKFSRGMVLIACDPPLTGVTLDKYLNPTCLAEVVAHEVGHTLGMWHVANQSQTFASIMDYSWIIHTEAPVLPSFSSIPLQLILQGGALSPVTHNEQYYLLRWVEGIRAENLSAFSSGGYDLPSVKMEGEIFANSTTVNVNLSARDIYNVSVIEVNSETGMANGADLVINFYPVLTQHQLTALHFNISGNNKVRIVGSTVPDGERNVAILPQGLVDEIAFTPVQGQTLNVVSFEAGGSSTQIGTGTTTSVTTSPIMPKDISVKPTGFDGAHVQVEFECEPSYQYTLERSENGSVWTPVPALTNVPGSNEGRLSLLDENAGQEKKKLFYRVRVTMPTTP